MIGISPDFVSIAEIAEMTFVTRAAVSNWVARYPDFPEPVVRLKIGPIWNRTDVAAWIDKHDKASPVAAELDLLKRIVTKVANGLVMRTSDGNYEIEWGQVVELLEWAKSAGVLEEL